MGRGSWVLRALFGTVVFLGVIWFSCVGILAHRATRMTTAKTTVVVTKEKFEHWDLNGRGRHHNHLDLDFHFVIKRRVPNGPDPIHNRRASQARQPPGQT